MKEAAGKLRTLSPERSERVLALIEDLADLQALEDKQDVEDARAALAEPGEDLPWGKLRDELDAIHGHHPATCPQVPL